MPELGDLAEFLRGKRSGIPYVTLAARSIWGASTLKRATSGKVVPEWRHVRDYLRACDVPPGPEYEHARELLGLAEKAWARRPRSTPSPRPDLFFDRADLSRALRDAYTAAGRPPLRTVVARCGGFVLSRSTTHRIVKGRTLPADIGQYIGFLAACEVPLEGLGDWFVAWHKVWGRPLGHTSLTMVDNAHPLLDALRAYVRWANEESILRTPPLASTLAA
ncbi:hypothetical protein [Streptomyces sp. NBC_00354]|uniref:hypothetical protein n=1 Tax=Streptomyces sp. NBC_00354 TaxID=2975723 RepID=UPI002E261D49